MKQIIESINQVVTSRQKLVRSGGPVIRGNDVRGEGIGCKEM